MSCLWTPGRSTESWYSLSRSVTCKGGTRKNDRCACDCRVHTPDDALLVPVQEALHSVEELVAHALETDGPLAPTAGVGNSGDRGCSCGARGNQTECNV